MKLQNYKSFKKTKAVIKEGVLESFCCGNFKKQQLVTIWPKSVENTNKEVDFQ